MRDGGRLYGVESLIGPLCVSTVLLTAHYQFVDLTFTACNRLGSLCVSTVQFTAVIAQLACCQLGSLCVSTALFTAYYQFVDFTFTACNQVPQSCDYNANCK